MLLGVSKMAVVPCRHGCLKPESMYSGDGREDFLSKRTRLRICRYDFGFNWYVDCDTEPSDDDNHRYNGDCYEGKLPLNGKGDDD